MKNLNCVIDEDLKIMPGVGATVSVGSDKYPYYVSEVLPNGVIGMYEPSSWFDDMHPWEGGDQVVEKFDPNHGSTCFIKRRYGHWWSVDKYGKPIKKFIGKYSRISFGYAISYQDPSF